MFPAIPALQPIVYDLFVLRAFGKSDGGEDLETQREVVVSMLFRLVHYPEVWHFVSPFVLELVSHLVSKSVDRSVRRSVGQSVIWSVGRSVGRPVYQSVIWLVDPLDSQSVSQLVTGSVAQ